MSSKSPEDLDCSESGFFRPPPQVAGPVLDKSARETCRHALFSSALQTLTFSLFFSPESRSAISQSTNDTSIHTPQQKQSAWEKSRWS